jgi:Zn-dependent alcohol dehydrogenase
MRGDGGGDTGALRQNGSAIGGGFFGQSSLATYALARQSNTVALTESMDPALAAPRGCCRRRRHHRSPRRPEHRDRPLRTRGTLAVVGLGAPVAPLPVGLILGRGLSVRGVVEGDSTPHTFIPHLVELWRRGDLPLEKLATTYHSEAFDFAWDAARTGRVIKPVLVTDR